MTSEAAAAATPPVTADDLHRNLMVNYLPAAWTSADLQALFQPYGTLEACHVVMNKQTQRSKAYGFVKYLSRAEAEVAIAALNGYVAEDRALVVKKADFGKGPPGHATVYVSGFTPELVTEEMLQSYYEPCGTIQRLKLHPPQPGKRGVAFVTFECYAEAELAVAATHGQQLPTGDVLQAKLDHRTSQAAMVSHGKVLAGPPIISAGGGGQGRSPLIHPVVGPTLRGRAPPVRFEPYEPAVPHARHPPRTLSAPTGIITPLPNGADGNYCLFVHGPQSPHVLEQLFMPFGVVADVRCEPGKKFGFVSMPVYHEAVNAITNLNGQTLPGGVTLQVRLAADPRRDGAVIVSL
jgi:cold-inducible RNA-binding protein